MRIEKKKMKEDKRENPVVEITEEVKVVISDEESVILEAGDKIEILSKNETTEEDSE